MNRIYRSLLPVFGAMALTWAATSCRDEFLYPDGIPEGSTTVNVELDFSPYSESRVRSFSDNNPGRTMSGLDDVAILVYDSEGNLIDNYCRNLTRAELNVQSVPRTDADVSGGYKDKEGNLITKTANEKTDRGTFQMELDYGVYYIYAVANVGRLNKEGKRLSSSLDWLKNNHGEDIRTVTGLLGIQVDWDDKVLGNNKQMLGVFTDGRSNPVSTPDNSDLDSNPNYKKIIINRPGMTCHSWVRRCAAKITVDFDGSNLLDNATVYFRQVTVHDVARSCFLGSRNSVSAPGQMISNKSKNDYTSTSPEGSATASHDNYRPTDGMRIIYSTSDDHLQWPGVSRGKNDMKKFKDADGNEVTDYHSENAPALFLYENMQGEGEEGVNDKEMTPADYPSVSVDKKDEMKDNMPYGSYIEVEGYYDYHTSMKVSKGKIYYRFMLGKDTKINFDTERNYHYKLTLKPRGMGNDYDWHIEYNEKEGFEIRDPYFVSYLYNHSSTIPFKYRPTDPSHEVYRVEAEIVGNNWWPDGDQTYANDVVKEQYPRTSGAYSQTLDDDFTRHTYTDGKKPEYPSEDLKRVRYTGNGFLSLRQTNEPNITTDMTGVPTAGSEWLSDQATKYMNDNYYFGKGADDKKIDRSRRMYYFDGTSDATNDKESQESYSMTIDRATGGYDINIPIFTRAKCLVKKSGYTGNNPFVGHTRTAFVRLTVYLRDKTTKNHVKKDSQIVRVEQVKRVVNPKGIYRKAGNNQPFHVRLMELASDNATNFNVITSRGPWMAEVLGADDFLKLNGRHKVIHGNTDSKIDFTINFNQMHTAKDPNHYAVIRVRYNNYTCVHLIFVRQGYDPVEIGGVKWRISNLRHPDLADTDFDPRDEGSLFKRNNLQNPIHPSCNVYSGGVGFPANFTPLPVVLCNNDGTPGSKVDWNSFDGSGNFSHANMVTMKEYSNFYTDPNVLFGFGVLYADGATETADNIYDAYGYYYGETGCEKRGMRGLFGYHWNPGKIGFANDNKNGLSIFFPMGRSGYGHRKTYFSNWAGTEQAAVLRYSSGRVAEYPSGTRSWLPLFFDLYKRPGAIYWAKDATATGIVDSGSGQPVNEASEGTPAGLDINFFTYDVNFIGLGNIYRTGNGSKPKQSSDACFIRLKAE